MGWKGRLGERIEACSCTSILYRVCYDPPHMNTPVREGERDDRGVPYPVVCVSRATTRNRPYPVLKCSSVLDLVVATCTAALVGAMSVVPSDPRRVAGRTERVETVS